MSVLPPQERERAVGMHGLLNGATAHLSTVLRLV